jgi:hypothetical protein
MPIPRLDEIPYVEEMMFEATEARRRVRLLGFQETVLEEGSVTTDQGTIVPLRKIVDSWKEYSVDYYPFALAFLDKWIEGLSWFVVPGIFPTANKTRSNVVQEMWFSWKVWRAGIRWAVATPPNVVMGMDVPEWVNEGLASIR